MTPSDRLSTCGPIAAALALVPALALGNGAAPLVRLEALPLICETVDGAAVAIDDASVGGSDVLEVWDGPVRRRIPLSEIEATELALGANGLEARIRVGGQAFEGDIRAPAGGGDLLLTGREPATGAEIEVLLAGCARLYRDADAGGVDREGAEDAVDPEGGEAPPVALH